MYDNWLGQSAERDSAPIQILVILDDSDYRPSVNCQRVHQLLHCQVLSSILSTRRAFTAV